MVTERSKLVLRVLSLLLLLIIGSGCDLFRAREPEPPITGSGTWLQPDTPDRVVQNIQTAVSELNAQNYVRSMTDDFSFQPTVDSQTRDPLIWNGWTSAQEEAYFNRLQGSAEQFSGHTLQLLDLTQVILDDTHSSYDATYVLRVPHSRTDEGIPAEVQGRLVWTLEQGSDGLWRLQRWVDQALGTEPSWSDLKASFAK